jgi:hypothetical protein
MSERVTHDDQSISWPLPDRLQGPQCSAVSVLPLPRFFEGDELFSVSSLAQIDGVGRYLRSACGFRRLERWLEVPLDSYVANGLRAEREGTDLPRRRSMKETTREVSARYQAVARWVAARLRTRAAGRSQASSPSAGTRRPSSAGTSDGADRPAAAQDTATPLGSVGRRRSAGDCGNDLAVHQEVEPRARRPQIGVPAVVAETLVLEPAEELAHNLGVQGLRLLLLRPDQEARNLFAVE